MVNHRTFSLGRFRRAFRYFLIGRLAQAVSTLVLTLVLVRVLDDRSYGTYMVVWGLIELAVPLTSLGLLPAAQRLLPELASHGSVGEVARFVRMLVRLRVSLVIVVCAALAAGWSSVSGWFDLSVIDERGGIAVATLIAANVLLRFAAELLESLLEQRASQTIRALLPLARLAVVGGLWVLDELTLENLILGELACSLILWIAAEIALRRCVRGLSPKGDRVLVAREFWTFVWHMSGVQLLNATANVGTIRVVVARALGVEAAGHFAFLQQLLMIAQRYMPSTLLANLIRPMLIDRHATAQNDEVQTAFGLLWKINLMLAWPLLPAAWLSGSALVMLLSGGRVADAGLTLAWLALGLSAMAQNQIIVMAMQVYRYTALARRISVFAVAAPLLVWLGAAHGLAGAAGGFAAALMLRSSVGLWALRRQPLSATLDWRGVWRFSAALVTSALIAAAVRPVAGDLIAGALMLLLVVVGTRLLPPLRRNEMAMVERALGAWARILSGWARR